MKGKKHAEKVALRRYLNLLIRRQLELKVLLYDELFPTSLIDYDA